MELKYIVLTIIKILISVPAVVLLSSIRTEGAVLMGGHLDNGSNLATNLTNSSRVDLSEEELTINNENRNDFNIKTSQETEEIPDPSPLVGPGYNLPENIFNKGKPFYLERDRITGAVDFESMSNLDEYDDKFAYEKNQPDVFDKSNIDRSDGSLDTHRKSDVNQLTPNIHDFLHIPAKYPDKFVYPLISSPYANTKIQGNVNKYHNHKDYFETDKPAKSPTFLSTKTYFNNDHKTQNYETTTTKATSPIFLTSGTNLMASDMNHPSFNDDYRRTTEKQEPNKIYLTTTSYATTDVTTEKSLFDEIFGDDDSNRNTYDYEENYDKTHGHAGPYHENVLTGSNMKEESAYDYFDEDAANKTENTKFIDSFEENVPKETTTFSNLKFENNKTDFKTIELQRNVSTIDDDFGNKTGNLHDEYDKGDEEKTTISAPALKVTSLPLGENHITHNLHQPIIVATQNLREQLSNEKVTPKPYNFKILPYQAASNIHIAPDQDTVSFVVSNHQHVAGQYLSTALKENPYESNPFKPYYTKSNPLEIQTSNQVPNYASSINVQPIQNAETSLAIGLPIDLVETKPGHVVDESLEINNEKIEFPKPNGPKVIFPEEKIPFVPDLTPPSANQKSHFNMQTNKEILNLNSKPIYEQLPSDLTPPNQIIRQRPPWDPRPGHFYSGRPEYARPPRPVIVGSGEAYKRLDNLPNVLPQFRPNMKMNTPHFEHKGYMRQPLLDRPSNKPIGIFETLQPPSPPKIFQIRKSEPKNVATEPPHKKVTPEQFMYYQTPPKVILANRRNSDVEVETLQMIQAKQDHHLDEDATLQVNFNGKETVEKPVYVVYPVNAQPLKLDAIDINKKESVVIGKRAESPLPPSIINRENLNSEKPIDFPFPPNDRHDSPILKPHPRPTVPTKSDFPYHLERPDFLTPGVPLRSANGLENERIGNEWDSSDEPEDSKLNANQISVKLKTYTEKPIAIAYTPTEPHYNSPGEKYSLPNYASPVIPEIRKTTNSDKFLDKSRVDVEVVTTQVPQLDFEAPFQASINVDGMSQGWSVVRGKEKTTDENETTTYSTITTSKFDMEKFTPELIGGFQPIYSFPDDSKKEHEINEREE